MVLKTRLPQKHCKNLESAKLFGLMYLLDAARREKPAPGPTGVLCQASVPAHDTIIMCLFVRAMLRYHKKFMGSHAG